MPRFRLRSCLGRAPGNRRIGVPQRAFVRVDVRRAETANGPGLRRRLSASDAIVTVINFGVFRGRAPAQVRTSTRCVVVGAWRSKSFTGPMPTSSISADEASADLLAKQSLVAESKLLLGNRLVVVVPIDSRLDIHRPADLASATVDRLALGDPDSVPAGKYAKKALEKLGLWDKLKTKVAAAGDVRQALAYVETGAAAAGIVYATDAAASKKVRVACEISGTSPDQCAIRSSC